MTTKLRDWILGGFVMTLILAYPYGVTIIGDSSLRFPDIFAIAAGIILCLSALNRRNIHIPYAATIVLFPFLIIELTLPIIGAVYWAEFEAALSSVRFALLYGPLVLFGLLYTPREILDTISSIDVIFRIGIIVNIVLAILHLLIIESGLSWVFLPAFHFEAFAVPPNNFFATRPAGTFENSTGLSVFGIITLSFYLSRLHTDFQPIWGIFAAGSLFLIFVTTSRSAVAAAIAIITMWLVLQPREIARPAAAGVATVGTIAIGIVSATTGGFSRFLRLTNGIMNDQSFATRFTERWPKALAAAREYEPIGTLIRPTEIVGTIDSGYLTYWAQGTWVFAIVLSILLIGSLIFAIDTFRQSDQSGEALFLLLLLIYIIPALVISIPLRRPIMVAAFVFALVITDARRSFIRSKDTTVSNDVRLSSLLNKP